jgi:hypothetical protein
MAINIKKKDINDVVQMVSTAYKNSLNFQRPYFERFNDYYRMYRAIREDGKQNYAGRAKLYIPYVFATIETIIPRLVGSKPKIEAVPREANDIEKAKMNNNLFNYQWDEMEMKALLKLWVKQTLIYGTGIVKLSWLFAETKKEPVVMPEEVLGGEIETEVKIDKPNAELVDLFDFYIDPNATTIDDASYIIHRSERDLKELQDNPNYTVPKGLVSQVSEDSYKIQRDAILGLVKPKDINSKKIEVLEFWGDYDFGKGKEPALIVVANNQLLRAEPNPYAHKQKPFIKMEDTQIPFSFWGIGEVEQMESLQYELNDIRNQRMDNVTLILNRMWKVLKGQVDEEDLVSQAGQIVHVDNMDALDAFETPDVTGSAYNEETLVKSDMQLVSGVNDITAGGAQGGGKGEAGVSNQTATGIALLQEAGNARFKYKLDNIEDALVSFGKQLLALNQQFLDTPRTLRIVGDGYTKWVDIEPDNIIGEYDITVEAGSTQPMNKSVRRAEARELLQTIMPLVQIGIDIKPIIRNLLQTYDFTNIDEVFPQPQVIPGMAEAITGEGQGAPQEQFVPNTNPVGRAPEIVANTPTG